MIAAEPKPNLQLVSKAISPPFRDGSKCLVRDLCQHLTKVTPHVLGTKERATALAPHVVSHPVYGASGGFSPALRENLQVAAFLLLSRRADLWHFVFAPNPKSSRVAQGLRRLRGVPTVQTVASPPRTFTSPASLLFGDIVVTQSAWTKAQFEESFAREGLVAPPLEVIPPPAPLVTRPEQDAINAARSLFEVAEGQALFVYPGDLEVSQGAAKVLKWSRALAERIPDVRVVIAYRDKTKRARERAEELAKEADPRVVRFACNVPDIHALVAASTALLFPVEDLYGKVDLPIVLLEAFRLLTPVVALNEGPLESLEGAVRLADVPSEWLDVCCRFAADPGFSEEWQKRGLEAVDTHYSPQKIAAQYEQIYDRLLARG